MQGVKNEKGEWIGFIERFELNLQMWFLPMNLTNMEELLK